MNFFVKIIFLFLLSSSAISNHLNIEDCPKIDEGSYLTKNNNGNSTYKGNGQDKIIQYLIQEQGVNLSKPILDVGSGYGSASYEFIKLGATNLYINELNADNLHCLKKNLEQSFPIKGNLPHYLLGDITKPEIFNKIPPNSLGLIYSQNVIHFFTAEQIINFFIGSAKVLENDGLLYISFENRFLEQQKALLDSIDKEWGNLAPKFKANKEKGKIKLDSIVMDKYRTTPFPYGTYCSALNYERTPKVIRFPGFPCLIETVKNGQSYHYHLLEPQTIAYILQKFGFTVLGVSQYNDHNGTIILLARKITTQPVLEKNK